MGSPIFKACFMFLTILRGFPLKEIPAWSFCMISHNRLKRRRKTTTMIYLSFRPDRPKESLKKHVAMQHAFYFLFCKILWLYSFVTSEEVSCLHLLLIGVWWYLNSFTTVAVLQSGSSEIIMCRLIYMNCPSIFRFCYWE